MPRYMQSFATSGTEQEAITQGLLAKPYVAVILDENRIDWGNEEPEPDYSKMPLTFEIISGGTITWKRYAGGDSDVQTIQYSKDGGQTWTSITSSSGNGTAINVSVGDKVMFKGTNTSYKKLNGNNFFGLSSACRAKVYGNILSLIYGDNYVNETELPSAVTSSSNFYRLFYECSGITDVENIVFPSNTKNSCYSEMFYGCTGIEKSPLLPASVVAASAYYEMFMGCRNLNHIRCLATNISASKCTTNFTYNVASTGTFVKNANMSSWTTGINGIPTNWTVVDA